MLGASRPVSRLRRRRCNLPSPAVSPTNWLRTLPTADLTAPQALRLHKTKRGVLTAVIPVRQPWPWAGTCAMFNTNDRLLDQIFNLKASLQAHNLLNLQFDAARACVRRPPAASQAPGGGPTLTCVLGPLCMP